MQNKKIKKKLQLNRPGGLEFDEMRSEIEGAETATDELQINTIKTDILDRLFIVLLTLIY